MDIRTGDKILLKQTKTTLKPPFDPTPYVVTQNNHNVIEAERNGKRIKRHASQVKKIFPRPKRLEKKEETEKDLKTKRLNCAASD